MSSYVQIRVDLWMVNYICRPDRRGFARIKAQMITNYLNTFTPYRKGHQGGAIVILVSYPKHKMRYG